MRNARKRVHGRGKEHTLIRLAGAPADDFREKGFAYARIADKDRPGSLGDELQIEQAENAGLQVHAALVVFEVKTIDRVLGVQARELETPFDRTAVAGFQFEVYQRFQRFHDTMVPGRGVRDRLIQLAGHRG